MDPPHTPQVRLDNDALQSHQPNAYATVQDSEFEMGGMDVVNQPELDPATTPDVQEITKKSIGINFLDFLTSPIVEIVVGQGDNETAMTAHQNLLVEAPFLAELVKKFEGSGARRITLPEENVDAFSCFLEFQYKRDYADSKTSIPDASDVDKSEENMLRHARIYTLAEKLGLPALKNLAHGKIHKIKGTPVAELAYARYVYMHTPAEDTAIRRPVASHWANQSHVLRHEVGEDFHKLCMEVPQFAFDVLSIILDRKEKGGASDDIKGSARKRARREI